jgi:hypothetical protein
MQIDKGCEMSLEILYEKYSKITSLQNATYRRYFFDTLDPKEKMIGIIGARGTGKTTAILQYLKSLQLPFEKTLYVSADSISFGNMGLYEIADLFAKGGGRVLAIDEIHKYKNFEYELKEIYDFLDLRVVFSGSSAMQIEHNKADLSRRALLCRIEGLSFREFLELKTGQNFSSYSLENILSEHISIAHDIVQKVKPFEYLKEYVQNGYYPYYFENPKNYSFKLEETINTVIESDLPIIFNIEPQYIFKLKQFVSILCESEPYELNITELSKKIGINRTTLYQYIQYLSLGKVLYSLKAKTKSNTMFSKPNKLYLNNTNLLSSYCHTSTLGTLRELFFAMQLRVHHKLNYPKKGDFLIDDYCTIEVGGKKKDYSQIKNIPNSFLAIDDIEIGYGNKIPLWLFGFLY